jgi:hypothetical protein
MAFGKESFRKCKIVGFLFVGEGRQHPGNVLGKCKPYDTEVHCSTKAEVTASSFVDKLEKLFPALSDEWAAEGAPPALTAELSLSSLLSGQEEEDSKSRAYFLSLSGINCKKIESNEVIPARLAERLSVIQGQSNLSDHTEDPEQKPDEAKKEMKQNEKQEPGMQPLGDTGGEFSVKNALAELTDDQAEDNVSGQEVKLASRLKGGALTSEKAKPLQLSTACAVVLSVIAFFSYPMLCVATFALDACWQIDVNHHQSADGTYLEPGYEEWWLAGDVNFECYTKNHRPFRILQFFLFPFIVFGIPTIIWFALRRVEHMNGSFRRTGGHARLEVMVHFLRQGYRSDCWDWEVVLMIRKASIAAVVVMSLNWSAHQGVKIFTCTFLTMCFAMHTLHSSPMRHFQGPSSADKSCPRMNLLAFLADFANFSVFLGALVCNIVNEGNAERAEKTTVKFAAIGFASAASFLFCLYYLRVLVSECFTSNLKRNKREKSALSIRPQRSIERHTRKAHKRKKSASSIRPQRSIESDTRKSKVVPTQSLSTDLFGTLPNLESTGHSTYAKNLARAGLLKGTNGEAGDEDLVYGSKLDNALDMDVNEAAQRLMMDMKAADLPVKGRPRKYDYESDDESESEGNDDESKSELNTGFGKQEQQKENSSKDFQK